MIVSDISITSIETMSVFDITTGAFKFTLDELQSVSMSQSEETTEITGKHGRRLGLIKRNKSVTFSGTNGMISHGLLELQTGSEFSNTATDILWTDFITVGASDGETKTAYKAVGTAGAEILAMYIRNENGSLGTKLEQAAQAGEGTFAYAPATKTLTFGSDITNGTELVCYYMRKITADVMESHLDNLSGKGQVYIDALGEDRCGNIYRVQIYIPKASFSGDFSFDMGDNQTVHNFDIEALAGVCLGREQYFTWTVFGVNAEDAA